MNLRLLIVIFLIGCSLSSCLVSKKEWRELEHRVNEQFNFYQGADLADTDNDGVPDMWDWEKDSQEGCPVDTRGITKDSDADGLPDCSDQEIFSPPGYLTNSEGVAQLPEPNIITEAEVLDMIQSKMGTQASAGEDEIDYTDPKLYTLNLPLPQASAYYQVPFEFSESVKTFGQVDAFIRSELDKAEFEVDLKYFLVKDPESGESGFAIITPIEVTDEKAVRIDWWHPDYNEHQINNFYDLIRVLRYSKIGYSRMMVILVTSAKRIQAPIETMPTDEVRKYLYENYQLGLQNIRALGIADKTIQNSNGPQILIYEFQLPMKDKDKKGLAKWKPNASFKKHLKGANLDALLDK